jgi:hypothetical protein
MKIQMKAAKRIRMKPMGWIDKGQPYEVESEKLADFHEKTGRGHRVKATKSTKKGD